jgi:hypothetical protein
MMKRIVSGIVLTLLFLSQYQSSPTVSITSSSTAMIYMEPEAIVVSPNQTFTITVKVAEVARLYEWIIKIYFEPTALKCLGASYPSDHVFAGKLAFMVPPVIEQNYVQLGATLFLEEDVFSGNGTLCEVEFQSADLPLIGRSCLNFSIEDTYLLDFNLEEIPCIRRNGYVHGDLIDVTWGLGMESCYVTIFCKHIVESFNFIKNETMMDFTIKADTVGLCNLTIPRNRIDGPFKVTINETSITYIMEQNATDSTLSFDYTSGTHHIKITGKERGYIIGDINGDGQVNIMDIAIVAKNFGHKEEDYP